MSELHQNEPIEQKASTPKKKTTMTHSLLDFLEIFVFALCTVILLFTFVFRLCTVSGSSMENSFYSGERLIVTDLFYTPKQGDVIVFHQTGEDTNSLNEPLVKRVIATEGETVSIQYSLDTMLVTITDLQGNVRELQEPYIKYEGFPLYASTTITVPEGHVFVMGDNRNNSKDSRHPQVGFVDERRILGKVVFRLSPTSRMGFIS